MSLIHVHYLHSFTFLFLKEHCNCSKNVAYYNRNAKNVCKECFNTVCVQLNLANEIGI